jgi:hypothetical protein
MYGCDMQRNMKTTPCSQARSMHSAGPAKASIDSGPSTLGLGRKYSQGPKTLT